MRGNEDRLRKVLFSVVRDYIERKKPVSSRRVLEITELSWSGATIRNDLKKLEEMGYLYQPHTSAGRIPTDKGLRFYLEEMLKIRKELKKDDIALELSQRFPIGDLEMILSALAGILARSAHGLAVFTKPSMEKMRLVRVHVTPIGEEYAAVSVITELGLSKVIPVPKMDEKIIEALEKLLNLFSGRTISELMEAMRSFKAETEEGRIVAEIVDGVLRMATSEGRVIYRGLYEIIGASNQKMADVVKILEDSKKLEEFLDGIDELEVFIGSENPLEELKDFSTFAAPYRKGNEVVGHVALITDRFVEYERVYSIVEFTSNRLTEYLTVASRR